MTIAIVGKYTGLKDAYKSLNEALFHGGIANRVKVKLEWIESEIFEREDPAPYLEGVHGILVPGGFGERGSEGKILAARFARERKRALFRHLLRHADGRDRGGAQSRRHRRGRLHRVRPERGAGGRPDDRVDARQRAREAPPGRRPRRHHAARRLCRRARPRAAASPRSTAAREISERHRHRYEVNTQLSRAARGGGRALLPACRPTACCPRSSSCPTIPGSSACSSTPN